MKDIIIYHGSTQIVEYPEIRVAKYNKDFYFGFYCTMMPEQARRWATRFTGKGIINEYLYRPNEKHTSMKTGDKVIVPAEINGYGRDLQAMVTEIEKFAGTTTTL